MWQSWLHCWYQWHDIGLCLYNRLKVDDYSWKWCCQGVVLLLTFELLYIIYIYICSYQSLYRYWIKVILVLYSGRIFYWYLCMLWDIYIFNLITTTLSQNLWCVSQQGYILFTFNYIMWYIYIWLTTILSYNTCHGYCTGCIFVDTWLWYVIHIWLIHHSIIIQLMTPRYRNRVTFSDDIWLW